MKKTPPGDTGRTSTDNLDAYSIQQFCERHGLSIAAFYKLKDQMPASFHVGNRRLISKEAAAAWRAERTAAAAEKEAAN